MRIIYFLLLALVILSCNQRQDNTLKTILNQDQLISQFFKVNITHDTTLITRGGCIIKIPKGALESDSTDIKLIIKEALTVTDIALAGMTTQSDHQALSSGGMIYFNAASGYKILIKKPLEILVPTNSYNREMKLYKGEKDMDDKINWKDPIFLPKDSTIQRIDEGAIIFKADCAGCHKIYEDYAAPALYGITDRRQKKWLYDYTRYTYEENSIGIDAVNYTIKDHYAGCLRRKFGSMMTPFPNLSDKDLDKIYGYIKSESDKRPDLKGRLGKTCCDSCEAYEQRIRDLYNEKEILVNENGGFFNLERNIPIAPTDTNPGSIVNNVPATIYPYSKVTPLSAEAVYYTINVSAVGWYNIDILMKEFSACQQSELFIRIQGTYKIDLNVVLIIPVVKAFVEGGKLKEGAQYGFDEDNGKIPLPQNAQSYVLAFGEYKNKIIFGKTMFSTQLKQTINILVGETTKEKITAEIKALNLDDVNTNIQRSKNAEKIIKTNTNIEEAEKLKPKNCSCDLYPWQPPPPA